MWYSFSHLFIQNYVICLNLVLRYGVRDWDRRFRLLISLCSFMLFAFQTYEYCARAALFIVFAKHYNVMSAWSALKCRNLPGVEANEWWRRFGDHSCGTHTHTGCKISRARHVAANILRLCSVCIECRLRRRYGVIFCGNFKL